MELRIMRYFLMITKTENITKAAELLHITQPTLSRQIRELEEELGVTLFERDARKLRLTSEGMLLKERAEEIIELTDKTIADLKAESGSVSGTIRITTGVMRSTAILSRMMSEFRKLYPGVLFEVLTSPADTSRYQLEKGLIDFGVMLEPIDLSDMNFIRFTEKESWCAMMRADDALAEKEYIRPKDLYERELVLPLRGAVAAELYSWLGRDSDDLKIAYSNTLGGTAAQLVYDAHAISLSALGSVPFLDETRMTLRPLKPEISTRSAIVWKQSSLKTEAAEKFIQFISCFEGMERQ